MTLWQVVKDLVDDQGLTNVKPETVDKILQGMTVKDWEEVKTELSDATKTNVQAKKSLDLVLKVLDLVIEKGIDLIL